MSKKTLTYWIFGLCLFYSLLSFFSLRPSDYFVATTHYQEDRSHHVYGLQRGGGRPLHRNVTNDYNNQTTTVMLPARPGNMSSGISYFSASSHCTVDQLRAIQRMLPDSETIQMNTNCPDSSTWMMIEEEYSSSDTSPSPAHNNNQHRPLAVFVGCNKGLDAINGLRMLSLNNSFDKRVWRDAMRVEESACNQHLTSQFPIHKNSVSSSSSSSSSAIAIAIARVRPDAKVYCIEAMPSTFSRLNRISHALGWQESFRVHHAAILDTNKEFVLFPNAPVGREDLGVSSCSRKRWKRNCENVTQLTIDTFVQQYIIGITMRENNETNGSGDGDDVSLIDILSIDVEGYDWPVLLGANQTLQRTKYLEFEYHSVGAWNEYNLSTAIDFLQQKQFMCYWAGHEGKLWRITGCWRDDYNRFKQWSNVACVHLTHAPRLARRMEERFLQTIWE